MASVTYDHVTKRFAGGTLAVNDFNLEVKDTEFMVLVGPSGCGKSTALRMLAGLEEISDGEIRIGDTVVNDMPPRDRDIAMVSQSYALYPHMTVQDNMAFGLRMRGTPKADIDRRVKQAAEILELGPLLNRKPRQLSGGQRQRVALGRAIVREPQAFLLDEPLSNLDAKLRVQTRIELQKQHRLLHATFIYVTHGNRRRRENPQLTQPPLEKGARAAGSPGPFGAGKVAAHSHAAVASGGEIWKLRNSASKTSRTSWSSALAASLSR